MRIDFNVLWIDDQPEAVGSQIKAITRRMEDEGFAFNATQCRSLDEVRARLAEDIFNDEIDLILVDLDLGGGLTGDKVIAEIREKIPYKDVVFYSAHTDPLALRQRAFDARVEGVYCAQRANLLDEVIGVFDSLVKKVLDLDHTRGVVMGATSDIDQMVLECLRTVHDKLGDGEKRRIVADAHKIVDKRIKESAALLASVQSDGSLAALVKADLIFTANDRLRVLSRMLRMEALKEHETARESVTQYMQEVVPKRNKLGHRVLSPEGRPTAIALGVDHTVSLQEMRELRRLILKLREDFRGLLKALAA